MKKLSFIKQENRLKKSVALYLIAPITAAILTGCTEAPAMTADKSPRPIQVMQLNALDSTSIKRFSGVLESADSANLAFRVPGTITEILFNAGDTIQQGQVIARLDPNDYQVTVLELDARLAEAKAAHKLATIELKRVKQATGDNAIAEVNLDRAISGYERSKAMVQVVQQNLKKAQDALSYTELKAPFDGVIGHRFFEQFEQAAPGIPAFTLHQPNQLQAVIDVPENLANQFISMKRAQIRQSQSQQSQQSQSNSELQQIERTSQQQVNVSWYGSQQSIPATLKEISTIPDPIKQTFTVIFLLSNTDDSLLAGKAIQLDVPFQQINSQYCVPYSSLITSNDQQSIFLIKDNIAVQTPVSVNALNANKACITGELQAGDKVVTAGVHFLETGIQVGKTETINITQ
ncbi:MAG: efflux RND transporter periplasmic adaptor subunit [Photobacterium frigidiphilum]|uniref:efflux RND transporter periplasmic adaptor subunit n=1 Tax=Photobacterium frigidiphilum TaxID=264736 RepID=UPI0030021F0C